MGEPFFDCQVGFVGCRALCLKTIMGVRDFEENMHRTDEVMTSVANGRNVQIYWTIKHSPLFFCAFSYSPLIFLQFCRMPYSSAVATLYITKEWPTLPTLCLITGVRRITALGLNSSWMQLPTRSVSGHDSGYSRTSCKILLAANLGMEKRSLQFKLSYSVLPLHHLQRLQPAKHVAFDIFRRLTIKWFFFSPPKANH